MIDHIKLWSHLQVLQDSYAFFDAADVQRFGHILEEMSGWELFRINPLQFASQHHFNAILVQNLFIYATKVGLFQMEWNMLCPTCGGMEHSYGSLHELADGHFHCIVCNVDYDAELDRYIEVSFTMNPEVACFTYSPFTNEKEYENYFISRNYHRSVEHQHFTENIAFRGFTAPMGGQAGVIRFEAKAGDLLRLLSLDQHMVSYIRVGDEAASAKTLTLDLTPDGITPPMLTIAPGETELIIQNHLEIQAGLVLLFTNLEMFHHITTSHPPKLQPFLTGYMLLNNQKFREALLIEKFPDDLQLRLSNITLLFTDLQNSTELYELSGDTYAYNLVQEHFKLLSQVVSKHGGAIVKTMGDAIMATFTYPCDGVCAAYEMLAQIQEWNQRKELKSDYQMELKIGLHTGSALAVKANETIDFFGQTVNIAARVQSIAQAGEIWLTDEVFQSPEVSSLLQTKGIVHEKYSILLKGVNRRSIVYKCALST
ncbi:adenylate/guanylate cyclase domain-containing protein [Brevibacillus dissolubilis]|uniref:adenylate/guanylate cyclase domain-containing protein n=1 Tax=Brevibacillus dissolubilis TaxID=1844116 RepID=UPI00111640DB|nr:adenylate/guanylate cyclase domain-containing protein [Brevibacillus dissolubilis]